ncbi:methyltransferase [Stutzerimonas xanthomarina]|uniref:Methylase of polypeptide chain release factors n=2 Tax=Stutzerimonas xanthomarina TaxID=271420 RepID=A0A1M5TKJ1_9GAMM|nr:class I SAM-dependent methyltransferase [Stutzerimonas xanthomarina]MCP9339974.1 class I SAM-dependent methyltransferase [Stutzerimonas xanthomarina]SEH55659.1 Methylase of polypeptide chain release factors [Stutzerimonas xanthomarina]SHH51180.1 Methylase of polypeptide chain release factors [Stutzerimonas xanthomarina DSM 18231]
MTTETAQDRALLHLAQALRERGYHFITPTPLTHERVNARVENQLAKDLEGVFGWSRPFQHELLPPAIFSLMDQAGVLAPCDTRWRSRVRLSTLDGQLFVHSAFPTDAPDAVFFGPDTYRFAHAIQAHLNNHPGHIGRVVDIGCGSGAGSILTALARPQAEVLAVDINPSALRLTRINAALAGADNLAARHSDLLNGVEGEFDLILANPPYLVDPGERAYRHGGGPLGAGLSLAIFDNALERLAPCGTLLLYTGVAMVGNQDPFLREVSQRLEGRGLQWTYREVDPDVFGEELLEGVYTNCDRIAAVVLEVTRPAG